MSILLDALNRVGTKWTNCGHETPGPIPCPFCLQSRLDACQSSRVWLQEQNTLEQKTAEELRSRLDRWRNVATEMPGYDQTVLVYHGAEGYISSGDLDIAIYNVPAFGGFTLCFEGGSKESITHWMPLPSPPEDSCRREAAPTPAPLLDGLSPQGQPAPLPPERSVKHRESGTNNASLVERQEKNS